MQEGQSDVDTRQFDKDNASKELIELGIEPNAKNIEAVLAQKQISQHPAGHEEVTDNLHDDERLRAAMQKHDIKEIIHSEGPTLWDHVKLSIQQINNLDVSDALKKDLRIVMLYHDLGKVEADTEERNVTRTQANLDGERSLHKAMIGHERYKTADIEEGLRSNGIIGEKQETYMLLIANHMNTALLEQKPQKTAIQIDRFSKTEMGRKEAVELLVHIFNSDGNATEHVVLHEGKILRSVNVTKTQITYDQLWGRYLEGKDRASRQKTVGQVANVVEPNPFEPKLKVFGAEAHRISKDLYPTLVSEVIDKAKPFFDNLSATAQLEDKPDYGDIDLIAQRSEQPAEELYKQIFGHGYIRGRFGKNQDSILLNLPPHGTYHVDFIHANSNIDFDTKLTFYSKGHLSRSIGSVANAAGFKYGVEGFCKRYKAHNGAEADFLISTNLSDGLNMLGYDISEFEGVETVDDIVNFIPHSPFFNPNIFLPDNLKASRMRVYAQRAQEKYIVDRLSILSPTDNYRDPDHYFKLHFPDKYQEYLDVLEKEKTKPKKERAAINGFIVQEYFGLKPGQTVGQIVAMIRSSYPNESRITKEVEVEIRKKFNI